MNATRKMPFATLLSLALLSVATPSAALAQEGYWHIEGGEPEAKGKYVVTISDGGEHSIKIERKNKRRAEEDAQTVCDAVNAAPHFVDPCEGQADGCDIPPGEY